MTVKVVYSFNHPIAGLKLNGLKLKLLCIMKLLWIRNMTVFNRSITTMKVVYNFRRGIAWLTLYCVACHIWPVQSKFWFQFKKGSPKKILWASRLWVGRRKETILCYVPKNYVKKNSCSKGLKLKLVACLLCFPAKSQFLLIRLTLFTLFQQLLYLTDLHINIHYDSKFFMHLWVRITILFYYLHKENY